MKMTIDTKSFVDAVGWVSKMSDTKEANSYLSLIVDVENSTGALTHLNMTSFLKSEIQVLELEVDEDIKKLTYAIESQYLQRLASSLSNKSIPITLEKKNEKAALVMETENGVFTLPTFEFKAAEEPELEEIGDVDDREMFDSLQRLSKLCDANNEGSMPALGAVDIRISPEDKNISMMGTDRYTLGEITIDFEPTDYATEFIETLEENTKHKSLLFPMYNASKLTPSKGITAATSIVYEPQSQKFGYKFADGRVAIFSMKDGNPINYTPIKNKVAKEHKYHVLVSLSELKNAISVVSNLSWDDAEMQLTFSEDELTVGDLSGANSVSIALESGEVGEEFTEKFSKIVLNKSLHPISTKTLKISWDEGGEQYVMNPVLDDGEVVSSVFVMSAAVKR